MKKNFKHAKFTAVFTDENGYFSFTGNIDGASGAVGDEIAKIYPDFKLLAEMHLANCKTGKPMHAWKNAEYWAEQNNIETLARHLRCSVGTAVEYKNLLQSHLSTVGISERLTPYRKFHCSLPFTPFKGATIHDRETAEKRYDRCHHEWIQPVIFSADSLNLSGEKAVYCPKCRQRPQLIDPCYDVNGIPWDNDTFNLYKQKQILMEVAKTAAEKLADFQTELELEWQSQVDEVYELINDTPTNLTNGFMNPLDENGEPLPEYEDILSAFDEPEKAIAVASLENIDVADVTEQHRDYSAGGNDYMVLTDDEADEKWDESLENYIDECLEIPESMVRYFDREAWKYDARIDGRGHSLSGYDGEENEEKINGTTYFLYRQ